MLALARRRAPTADSITALRLACCLGRDEIGTRACELTSKDMFDRRSRTWCYHVKAVGPK